MTMKENSKKCFLEEIDKFIEEGKITLSSEALEFFKDLKHSRGAVEMTENGKKILQFMQNNHVEFNNIFKAKNIGEGLGISGRSVSGSIRKLVTDGYVEKIGKEPVSYSITDLGKSYQFDKE